MCADYKNRILFAEYFFAMDKKSYTERSLNYFKATELVYKLC